MKETIYLLLFCLVLTSCSSHKNTEEQIQQLSSQLSNDAFTMTGDYHWNFKLMGADQHSIHSLHADYINYKMEGSIYSTEYRMQKLSFEASENKWIGEDEEGIVYVLFFDNYDKESVTIYKHKCKTNGLAEALEFALPDMDATTDHGWNSYASEVQNSEDLLPIAGKYNRNKNELVLSDQKVILNGKAYEKMSYHAGERRWVGVADSLFLQIFFEDFAVEEQLNLSVNEFIDLEKAYKTKYQAVQFFAHEKNTNQISELEPI